MNKIFTLISFIFLPVFGFSTTYYVTLSGNDSNSGTSEANAWRTIHHAAQTAVAGDIVYVKAGNYGDENVEFANSGTSENPITFIGYQNVLDDIATGDKDYYTPGGTLDISVMPTLCGSDRSLRRGIDFKRKSYITLRNFQVKHYTSGIHTELDSEFLVVDNCIVIEIGPTITPVTPQGFGICIYGDNNSVLNSIVTDAGGMNISIYGDNNLVEDCQSFATSDDNEVGYYILIQDGTQNIVRNCVANRMSTGTPLGHGIGSRNADYNQFINCEVYGVNVPIYARWPDAAFNQYIDCTVYDTHGYIVRDGAHDNEFIRCKTVDCVMAIRFFDSGEFGKNDPCAYNNTFTNCQFLRTNGVVFNITQNSYDSNVNNNKFVNCTFTCDEDWVTYSPSLFTSLMPSNNNEVINCTFSHVEDFHQLGWPAVDIFPLGFSFKNCNVHNFETSGGRGDFTTDVDTVNILFEDPMFVDEANNNFQLQDTSPLIGAGTSDSAPSTDFAGNARPLAGTFEIGAFESLFGTALVPTLSEWGFIILALLLLNLGTLYVQVPKLALANTGVKTVFLAKTVFYLPNYIKILIGTGIAVFITFGIAIFKFDYALTSADPFGIILSTPLLAFLIYLLKGDFRK